MYCFGLDRAQFRLITLLLMLGPFHTERATPTPMQTNFYCFQRSLSHSADAGHRPRSGDMQCGLPLGWSRARTRDKVLCNIASNGCLHTEREKPALTDSFNDTQWKLVIKTGDKNKYVSAGGSFSPLHVKRIIYCGRARARSAGAGVARSV